MREDVYKVENVNTYLRHEDFSIRRHVVPEERPNDDHHAIASRAVGKVQDRSSHASYDTDDRSIDNYESLLMIRPRTVPSNSDVTDLRSQRYLSRNTRRRHVYSIFDDRVRGRVDMTNNFEISNVPKVIAGCVCTRLWRS